jgi:2'-5' RNA ligase
MNTFDLKKYLKNNPLISEGSNQTYDYNCAMIYFDFPHMNKIQDAINPKDIYYEKGDRTFGLEDEPHCTLLYGLHSEVTTDDIKNIINKYEFTPLKLINVSLFENEKYDVLKFDVVGEDLHKINEELKKYPFTSDYPDYHPHSTIGYLKSGKGKRYTEMLKNMEFDVIPNKVVYSKADGEKDIIDIKLKLNYE